MDKKFLRGYAKLIAVSGVNVQKDQEVVLRTAPVELDFITMVVEELYLAGAKRVRMEWVYQPITKLNVQYQSVETLGTVTVWQEAQLQHDLDNLCALVVLESSDPDGLNGIDFAKMDAAAAMSYPIRKKYRDAADNRFQWCVAAVPSVEWARKVFPGKPDEEAVEALWYAILKCSRALENPVEAWAEHDRNITERSEQLNKLHLRRLNYRSESTGTDFTVGLLPESRFLGGDDVVLGSDVHYNPNIPTEEIFTTPRAGDADGTVYSTRPLSYNGMLIENFSITFENGKAVSCKAERGEEVLRQMIATDEGSCMLGEVALVPYESPISQSGILFYNTLFDENASCHLALGVAYTACLEGFENRTPEENVALGANTSMIHVDFMIGSADLDIDGVCEDGRIVPIFRNGTWAL